MDVLHIAAVSRQYVKAQVTVTASGAVIDPTADVVKVAFVVTGSTPQVGDWQTASWETDTTVTPSRYYARCLVGPGGDVTLAPGLFEMWVQVTDNPEQPALSAGMVKVL